MTTDNRNCAARMSAMLNNTPPPPLRYSIVSPYPEYTQYEIDMRRKAELLQYKKNTNITKKQSFSQTINRQKSNIPKIQACEFVDTTVYPPRSASASGVPGGGMLFYDPTVPLYNYSTSKPSYAITNPNIF
jgi:hypothetical protein